MSKLQFKHIERAEEIAEEFRNLLQEFSSIVRNSDNITLKERYRSYVQGHIEPLIDPNHTWLTHPMETIQGVIESLHEEFIDNNEPPEE